MLGRHLQPEEGASLLDFSMNNGTILKPHGSWQLMLIKPFPGSALFIQRRLGATLEVIYFRLCLQ
jgi:hypothetical protein